MDRFLVLQRWLLVGSIFFALFGVAAALLGNTALFGVYTAQIDRLFWPGGAPEGALAFRGFIFGPLGGTIAGSYAMMAAIVAYPFRRRELWAWHALVWSHVLWFVVDSAVSVAYGAYFNVWMINLAPLILLGVPLLLSRPYFGRAAPDTL